MRSLRTSTPRWTVDSKSMQFNGQLEGIAAGIQLVQLLPLLEKVVQTQMELLDKVESVSRRLDAQPAILDVPDDLGEMVWLDEKRAAHRLSMSKTTFQKHVYNSPIKISKNRVGGKNYYNRHDLDLFMRTWEDKSKGYA